MNRIHLNKTDIINGLSDSPRCFEIVPLKTLCSPLGPVQLTLTHLPNYLKLTHEIRRGFSILYGSL